MDFVRECDNEASIQSKLYGNLTVTEVINASKAARGGGQGDPFSDQTVCITLTPRSTNASGRKRGREPQNKGGAAPSWKDFTRVFAAGREKEKEKEGVGALLTIRNLKRSLASDALLEIVEKWEQRRLDQGLDCKSSNRQRRGGKGNVKVYGCSRKTAGEDWHTIRRRKGKGETRGVARGPRTKRGGAEGKVNRLGKGHQTSRQTRTKVKNPSTGGKEKGMGNFRGLPFEKPKGARCKCKFGRGP